METPPDRAGRYRHRATLEAPADPQGTGAYGEPQDAWQAVADVRCEALQLTGQRLLAAQQQVAEATWKVTCRWRPGVDETMRWNLGGRLLNVLAAFCPDGKQIELVCLCAEWKQV